jgi:hypothetical protein
MFFHWFYDDERWKQILSKQTYMYFFIIFISSSTELSALENLACEFEFKFKFIYIL